MPNEKHFVFKSNKMKNIYSTVEKVADSNVNMIISGEAGIGKSMIAKLLHLKDKRCGKLVTIEAIEIKDIQHDPKAVITFLNDSFKKASDGTLLIKSINGLTKDTQERIAIIADAQKKSKNFARLVATTTKDLRTLAKQEKACYKLCDTFVADIYVAPIRERREDIVYFCEMYMKTYAKDVAITKDALDILSLYDWQHGNISEIINVMKQVILTNNKEITATSLPSKLRVKTTAKSKNAVSDDLYKLAKGLLENMKDEDVENYDPYYDYLKYVETPLIKAALDICKHNKVQAAKIININRNTLNKKIREYDIE